MAVRFKTSWGRPQLILAPSDARHQRHGGSLQDELWATPADFGALVTTDHVVLGSFNEPSRKGDTAALMIEDHATKRIEYDPYSTKSSKDTTMGILHYVGSDDKDDRSCFDGSGEFDVSTRFSDHTLKYCALLRCSANVGSYAAPPRVAICCSRAPVAAQRMSAPGQRNRGLAPRCMCRVPGSGPPGAV